MRKLIATIAIAATLAGGAVAGFAFGTPGTSVAQEAGPSAEAKAGKQGRLAEVLRSLVDDGTLTQEQADEIRDAARRRAGAQRRHHRKAASVRAAADALGVDAKVLVAALRDGKTIADVAAEQDVDVQVVIDALVAKGQVRIDKALEAGKIDQARADELHTRLVEKVTTFVNEGRQKD